MDQIFDFIKEWVNIPYLITILCLGKFLSDDGIISKTPFRLKAFLLKIDIAWRVFILSLILGVSWHYLDKDASVVSLLVTFIISNTFYALFAKYFFNWLESRLKSK